VNGTATPQPDAVPAVCIVRSLSVVAFSVAEMLVNVMLVAGHPANVVGGWDNAFGGHTTDPNQTHESPLPVVTM
jgi:hypothetical protein